MDKKIGYTTGVFDLFHIGHLNLLERAKENCDFLLVGIQSDEFVTKTKDIPVLNTNERVKQIKALDFLVDDVFVYGGSDEQIETHEKIINDFKPHIFFKGSD